MPCRNNYRTENIMDKEEILQLLSDNHRILILSGGVICFISLFLPFLNHDAIISSGYVTISGLYSQLSDTWLFWIYLILIIGVYTRYFHGFGEAYPYLYLAIGVLLLLMTLYATQMYSGHYASSVSYGFFLEFIGSLSIAVGGYYFYENNNHLIQKDTGE